MAIITAAQAKAYIPTLSASSSTDDALLVTLTSRFDAVAAAHLGYVRQSAGAFSIESGTYIEYLDGPGGRELHLSAKPVTAIGSIYDDPDAEYTSDELIASADYTLYGIEGLVMLDTTGADTYFSTAHRAIKATYTAGYSGCQLRSFMPLACRLRTGTITAQASAKRTCRHRGKVQTCKRSTCCPKSKRRCSRFGLRRIGWADGNDHA